MGRDFRMYLSPKPIERLKKPRRIESLEDFYRLVANSTISVAIVLGEGSLRSSHCFEAYANHVIDESMVDGSYTRYTKPQFEGSIFAEAIFKKTMFVENIFD